MNDRELLELAAKAAGMTGTYFNVFADAEVPLSDGEGPWNPLTDDGDALRLAVKCRISPMLAETPPGNPEASYCLTHDTGPEWRTAQALHGDPYAATRRAIVRAAAEIGKGV